MGGSSPVSDFDIGGDELSGSPITVLVAFYDSS
jgi:hypothetical protein